MDNRQVRVNLTRLDSDNSSKQKNVSVIFIRVHRIGRIVSFPSILKRKKLVKASMTNNRVHPTVCLSPRHRLIGLTKSMLKPWSPNLL